MNISRKKDPHFIVGIDEVGRGALAGPVVVAAFCLSKNALRKKEHATPLRDSKKLSPKQRERWAFYCKKNPEMHYVISHVRPRTIERINISNAANTAALRAFEQLKKQYGISKSNSSVFLDGGLYLGNVRNHSYAKTVIHGDATIPAIALASIVAKVNRDKYMERLSKKYPGYGFEIHKGYGTKMHYRALRTQGISPVHRLTFLQRTNTII